MEDLINSRWRAYVRQNISAARLETALEEQASRLPWGVVVTPLDILGTKLGKLAGNQLHHFAFERGKVVLGGHCRLDVGNLFDNRINASMNTCNHDRITRDFIAVEIDVRAVKRWQHATRGDIAGYDRRDRRRWPMSFRFGHRELPLHNMRIRARGPKDL